MPVHVEQLTTRVGVVKINKPQSLNALSSEILKELKPAIEQLEADANIRVIILTGEGKTFVAGADISEMKDMSAVQANKYAMQGAKLFQKIETHDCFTSSEYAAISASGITEPGKEYEAVENGVIAFDGAKPINPSGGLIGCGHPVGASGARMFLDLYKQVTGKAASYQVKGAKNGMMLNIGGSATTNYVFIVGKE